MLEIESNDLHPWSIISRPAMLSTQIKVGISEEERLKLTKLEKKYSFLAGALIK